MYKHCPTIVAISGFLILGLGILCTWYGFPKLVESQINENIMLKEGSQVFAMWRKQPFPLFYKIYFFEVTNPADVMIGGKPVLREKGPYVYDLYPQRDVIEVDELRDTIKYNLKKHYVFNATASGCYSDEDTVTIINAALIGTVLKVHSLVPGLLSMVETALPYIYPNITDLFLRVKVKDILFDGITLYCSAPEIASMCSAMKAAKPNGMNIAPNGKDLIFSMFGAYNDTPLGPLVLTRGIKNTVRGALVEYRDEPQLDVWEEDGTCNMLNGSDSGLYFPMKKPADKIYTFVPEVCRSLAAFFDKKTVKHGIDVYRYSSTEETLSTAGVNQCFCEPADDDSFNCPVQGVLNLQPCLMAPVYMSNPHFYLGNKSLLDYVTGLNPVKEKHESYVLLEPKTATPLEGAKRSQMNIEMRRFDNFALLQNVSEGYFPILWLEEGALLPDSLVDVLTDSFKKIALLDVIKWVIICLGLIMMMLSFVLLMYQERLMCFSTNGSVNVSDPGGLFTTRSSQVPPLTFNTTVVYPTNDNPAFIDTETRNNLTNQENNNTGRKWPHDSRFT